MKISNALALTLCLLVFSVCGQNIPKKVSSLSEISVKPLTGGFIQYNSDIIKTSQNPNGWSLENWSMELKAFQDAGMDTIIIQFLELNRETYMTDPKDKSAVDPTEAILSYADAHGIKVFIGLWNKEWGSGPIRNLTDQLIDDNWNNCKRVGKNAWKKYGHHKSFYGWYIPQEIWNIKWSPEQITKMRKLYRRISDKIKGFDDNNKPVAISPYFDPLHPEGNEPNPAMLFTSLLSGSGINILMLQDGVGANCLETKEKIEQIKPFFQEFYDATKTANVEFWGNIESFKTISGGCLDDYQTEQILVPTEIERLSNQLEAAAMISTDGQPIFKKLVTFDFFEFMSPVHQGKTQSARQKLYADYKKKVGLSPNK